MVCGMKVVEKMCVVEFLLEEKPLKTTPDRAGSGSGRGNHCWGIMSRRYDGRRHPSHHSHQQHQQHQQQFQQQPSLSIKIEPSEIPKLSLSHLKHEEGLTPPLRNRDIEEIRHHEQQQRTNERHKKLGGSGKFPSLGKNITTGEYFQGDDIVSRNREQRKVGGRLPPRELQPLTHASSEKLNRDNPSRHQHPLAIPSRRHGREALEPLNPMLKSNSLSKIQSVDHEPQRVPRALESTLPSLASKNSLVPLHNSGRLQPRTQSTRPW